MKYFNYIHQFLLIIFICFSSVLYGQQYPVSVVASSSFPSPVYLYAYGSSTSSISPFQLQLLLQDVSISDRKVRLSVSIEGRGIQCANTTSVIGAPELYLTGGMPVTLRGADLNPYFKIENLVGITSSQYHSLLPDGVYNFCFTVYDDITGLQLSRKTCVPVSLLSNPPPILQLPENGSKLLAADEKPIIFEWLPRHTISSNVVYDFRLVELMDEYASPAVAITTNPVVYEGEVRGTRFVYDGSYPLLRKNRRYAWQVRAKVLDGLDEIPLFQNDGKSEVYSLWLLNSCDPLTGVDVATQGVSKLRVSWDDDRERYKSYTISYRKVGGGSSAWFDSTAEQSPYTIKDLESNSTYEVKVRGNCLFTDSGYSSILEGTTKQRQEDDPDYQCGILPPEVVIKNQNPHPGLSERDIITAGDFKIILTHIDQQSGGYISGTGEVVVPFFFKNTFSVSFTNIFINTENQLAKGEIVTDYDQKFGKDAKMVVDVDFKQVSDDVFGKKAKEAKEVIVEGVYKSHKLNENGAIVITVEKTDETGRVYEEEVIISGSRNKNIVIGDTVLSYNKASTKEESTVTKSAKGKGGGLHSGTGGVDGKGNVNRLSTEDVVVYFKSASDDDYSFDALTEGVNTSISSKYKRLKMSDGKDYVLPYKLISDADTPRTIKAIAEVSNDSIVPSRDIVFKTKSGVSYPATWSGNEATITLEKKYDYSVEEVYATLLTKSGENKGVVGGFVLYHVKKSDVVPITLVKLNDASIPSDLTTEISKYYASVGAVLDIKEETFQVAPDLFKNPSEISIGDSNILSHYTSDQRALYKKYKAERGDAYDADRRYLFITNFKGVDKDGASVSGFMPLGGRFGFIFNANLKTICHELGHGVFGLKHPWDAYGQAQNTTPYLMDYTADGMQLPHMDWEEMHKGGIKIYTFQDDDEGKLGGKNNPDLVMRFIDRFRCSYITEKKFITKNEENYHVYARDIKLGAITYEKIELQLIKGYAGFKSFVPLGRTKDDIKSDPNNDYKNMSSWVINNSFRIIFPKHQPQILSYLYPEKENWSINVSEVKNNLEKLLGKSNEEIIEYLNKTDECTIGAIPYNLIEKLISKLAKGTIRDSKEKAIVRLIKSIQPSDNSKFLSFLDKNKSILLNLISELNDTIVFYGGNNYTSFISAFVKMYSSSKSFYEEKIKKSDIDLVKNEFSLYEKILLLEPETMVTPRSNDPAFIPQSSIYYKGKLNNDGLIDIKELTKTFKFGCASSMGAIACDWSFLATYENDFVNGVDPLSPIIIFSTPSLDLVKTALDGVNQGINVYIVPAIYLEYANQKRFNKDVEDGIVLTLDLVTIASSGSLALAKVGKVRRIIALAEVLGASANIAVNHSELSKYRELQTAVNAFNTLLGIVGLKNLTKGVYKSMQGMSQSAKELINSNKSIRTLLLNELDKLKITTQQYAKLSSTAQKEWDKIKIFRKQLFKLLGKSDLADAGGKIKIPTQLAGKLGVKTSKLDNWLVKYADDLGDDATKLLDDLKDNIGNKQVLEVLEDAQGRLTVVAKGDGITNDVISLQKNVDGNYVNVTYNRAYNPTANMDIDVALSKNKLVPDYTKTQAGVLSTKYLYPKNLLPKGKSPVVRIKMTGKRTGKGGDFDLANQQAGLTGTKAPEGYVWHHMDDFDPITGECTMQLVKSNAHTKVKGMAHSGSVAQYKAYYVNKDKAPNGLFY